MNEKIDLTRIPNHIAIILDGNGRWAKSRNMPRIYGHRKGAFNISDICEYADSLGVKVLSIYCFSTENWKRPADEVKYLMSLPSRFFNHYKEKIRKSNIKIVFSGRRDRLSNKLNMLIDEIIDITKDHKGIILNVCFDYGSRDEIIRAIKKLVPDINSGKVNLPDLDSKTFANYLDTKDLGDVDLLIRTSGEERISNFLLWQIAYAEFYFTKVLWPDFSPAELDKAILSYQSRNRRFGGLKEDNK